MRLREKLKHSGFVLLIYHLSVGNVIRHLSWDLRNICYFFFFIKERCFLSFIVKFLFTSNLSVEPWDLLALTLVIEA